MLILDQVQLKNRLRGISCNVGAGRFVHLIGANGAGKSSLLTVIAGLLNADSGEVSLNGRLVDDFLPSELAIFRCFQKQQQDTQFAIKVSEALGFFSSHTNVPNELEAVLEINQFMERGIHALSGGENKRVHLVRVLSQIWPALEQGKGLVLLDEPVHGLDFRHQHLLFDFLKMLATRGNLVIASHHDLNLCWQYADDVWMMQKGELIHQGNCQEVMTEANLESVFECRVNAVTHKNNNTLFQTFLDN